MSVPDAGFGVESWNSLAEERWGLRADDVRRRSVFALDFGLSVEQLRRPIDPVLRGPSELADEQSARRTGGLRLALQGGWRDPPDLDEDV